MTGSVMEEPVGASSEEPILGPLKPVRVAVAGLDRTGVLHAAVLSSIQDCEVVGVADARAAARRNLRGLGYRAQSFERVEKLLARTRPDALVVSAPHDQRAAITRQAIEAGVAVLVHRPFAANRAEAEALTELAATRGVPLACGHPLVYHPVFAEAQRALAQGVLGDLSRTRSSVFASWVFSSKQKLAWTPAGSAGGVTMQPASDLLFLMCWYLGVPVEARATWNRIYGEHEDELHGMLKLENGAEIGIDTSWSVPGYPRPATVIELEGMNGKMLVADDALELELNRPRAGYPTGTSRVGHAALPGGARFDLEGDAPYLMNAAFLAWITGGEPPPARAENAVNVLRVVEALYESARQGGKPVAVAR